MKKALMVLAISALLLLNSNLHAQSQYYRSATAEQKAQQASIKERAESMEVIEGTPRRPFKKIKPLWETAYSIDDAMKKMKKSAAKAEADAVIEFSVSTGKEDMYTIWGGGGTPKPIVQGWAVQWTGEELPPEPETKPIRARRH